MEGNALKNCILKSMGQEKEDVPG